MRKHLLVLFIAALFLTANAENTLLVGGDVSVLQSYEDHNVPYFNKDGDAISDMLTYLKSDIVGWNALRVRLFVNPQQKDGDWHTDAQVCQDLNYVVKFCKRVKAAGYSLL
ncbi:MAG: glycosyl hydrolase 53 family protein, partial [Paludibacteraceae bacterium]|nr:glycosyl hydrolase 53 family protein [Paludibacteraceae bacterium]